MATDLSPTKSDTAIKLVKAVASAVPAVGGPLGSLINDFIPTEINKRRDGLLLKLEAGFKKLEEKINADRLAEPYFISIFLQAFKSAMASEEQEKIDCYKAIILNTAIIQEPNIDEIKIMLKVTDNLTPLHMKLLKIFKDPEKFLIQNPDAKTRFGNVSMGGIGTLTSACLPGYPQDLIGIASMEIGNLGLAQWPTGGATMTVQGILSPRLTDFGKKYLDFITIS